VKRIWQLALLSLLLSALLVLPSTACQPFSRQGILNLWGTGPTTLDPAISADMSSHTCVMQIFSGLVRLDHELKIVPDIAEIWEKSPEGKTYTFYLRQGVKFQNGGEVKAADFKYSWAILLVLRICWREKQERSLGSKSLMTTLSGLPLMLPRLTSWTS
jgi:ABC-type transport system substrate-binding protein